MERKTVLPDKGILSIIKLVYEGCGGKEGWRALPELLRSRCLHHPSRKQVQQTRVQRDPDCTQGLRLWVYKK
jgi:hypothetical protein